MAFLADQVFDAALAYLDNVENLYICSAAPSNFTEASSTNKLGTKAAPTIGAVGDATPNGRKRTISAITDGTVDSTGTATHWALTDDSASLLVAWGTLSASQAVTSGNTFTLSAFDIRQPDVA